VALALWLEGRLTGLGARISSAGSTLAQRIRGTRAHGAWLEEFMARVKADVEQRRREEGDE
jgi:hypothetical protein